MSDNALDSNGANPRAQQEPIPVAVVSQPRSIEEITENLHRLQSMQMIFQAELEAAQRTQRDMHEQNQRAAEKGQDMVNDYLRWRDHTDFRLKVVQWSAIVGAIASVFRAAEEFFTSLHAH